LTHDSACGLGRLGLVDSEANREYLRVTAKGTYGFGRTRRLMYVVRESSDGHQLRGWHLPGRRPPRHCRGAAAMQSVNAGRPLRGRMPQERGAVVLQIRRQLHAQRVLDLGWLQ
jgi:hypothetical protein